MLARWVIRARHELAVAQCRLPRSDRIDILLKCVCALGGVVSWAHAAVEVDGWLCSAIHHLRVPKRGVARELDWR